MVELRQTFVLYLGRKLPGRKAEQIAVEISLAAESQTMEFEEVQEFVGRLAQRAASLVKEEFGGEILPPPAVQQKG